MGVGFAVGTVSGSVVSKGDSTGVSFSGFSDVSIVLLLVSGNVCSIIVLGFENLNPTILSTISSLLVISSFGNCSFNIPYYSRIFTKS